jgi:hypothetical protein
MPDMNVTSEIKATSPNDAALERSRSKDLPLWETPKLEDVSEQVMAQPYIRFT